MTVDMPPVGNPQDPGTAFVNELVTQIAQLRARVDQLQTPTWDRGPIMLQQEAGNNMKRFLQLLELEFASHGIPTSSWGMEMRRYLTDEALDYWLYLQSISLNFADWPGVKERFRLRFCEGLRETQLAAFAQLHWNGNHSTYTAFFTAAVNLAVDLEPPDKLLVYYFSGLPTKIRQSLLTGAYEIRTWQDAACALARLDRTPNFRSEEWRKTERELDEMRQKCATVRTPEYTPRNPKSVGPSEGRELVGRCPYCQEKGHIGADCPKRRDNLRRGSVLCSLCGGQGHFAKECGSRKVRTEQAKERSPLSKAKALKREN